MSLRNRKKVKGKGKNRCLIELVYYPLEVFLGPCICISTNMHAVCTRISLVCTYGSHMASKSVKAPKKHQGCKSVTKKKELF